MSEAKFTKGDWKVERFVNGKGFEISFNEDGEVVADYVYTEHDAHLIAAAPKMYGLLSRLANPNNCKKDIIHLLSEVDNLLAEARGGQ